MTQIKCVLEITLRENETEADAITRANTYMAGGYQLVVDTLRAHGPGFDTGCPRLQAAEKQYLNKYSCYQCGHEWEETYSCGCDSQCGYCGAKNCSPSSSEEIAG